MRVLGLHVRGEASLGLGLDVYITMYSLSTEFYAILNLGVY